jgi:hypothetical protein
VILPNGNEVNDATGLPPLFANETKENAIAAMDMDDKPDESGPSSSLLPSSVILFRATRPPGSIAVFNAVVRAAPADPFVARQPTLDALLISG